jgi:hypothetical protein
MDEKLPLQPNSLPKAPTFILDIKKPNLSNQNKHSLKNPLIINVKDQIFGAKGDGITIDKNAVQSAIDYVYARGGGTVYFPKGTYLVYGIKLLPNITLAGEGKRESILKAPDRVDLLIKKKFWRMFVTVTGGRGYIYEGDKDSLPLIFRNLTIDYNGPHQIGWQPGYNAEQNFCIELGASPKKPGHLKVIFDNCEIKHSVTDGISIIANVDCTITNCLFKTNCRGSITILGGHSVIRAKNITVLCDLRYCLALKYEVCVFGYGHTRRADFTVEDSYIEGEICIGMEPYSLTGGDQSEIRLKNIDASKGDYIFSSHGATFMVSNCKFGAMGGWTLMPENMTFTDCEFILTRNAISGKIPNACVGIMWNQGPTAWKNEKLTYNNCTFTAANNALNYGSTNLAAFNIVLQEKSSNNNKLMVNGGVVTNKLKHVLISNYGGMSKIYIKGLNIYSSDTAFDLKSGTNKYDTAFNITLDNIHVHQGKYMKLDLGNSDNRLTDINVTLEEGVNWLESNVNSSYDKLTISGFRTILGTEPPCPQTHGLPGDIYRLKSNPNLKWHCKSAGFWCESLHKNIPANWVRF